MKTLDMLKYLSENPGKKATKLAWGNDGRAISISKDGKLLATTGGSTYLYLDSVDEDWQLISEPVTFAEAMQAWAEGKTVKVECRALNATYEGSKDVLVDKTSIALTKNEILHGKWFIEEE